MKRSAKIIIILIFFAAVLFFLVLNLSKPKLIVKKACFQEHCFWVEVVSTLPEIERGLMFRNHLDQDKGMLFTFDAEGYYPFWMKNTLIPLDMVWINRNNEVVFIRENALPCHQTDCPITDPGQKAKYVLEVNGGATKDINLKIGDKVSFY